MKNRKSHIEDVTRRTGTLTRRDRDKYSEWGQDGDVEPKIERADRFFTDLRRGSLGTSRSLPFPRRLRYELPGRTRRGLILCMTQRQMFWKG